ncbi:MAG: polymerase, beta domain protein region [Alphaproteobacteria bacterium]|nr:polymerase, beta domain protein region [Alphaproteobacteria bacterium]
MLKFKNIRLAPSEVEAICETFRQFFAPEDHLWLFGSRANLKARGGDIDLYIETTIPDVSSVVDKKISFVTDLYDKIGEQKIDVVLRLLSSDFQLPIYDIAKQEGVQLV